MNPSEEPGTLVAAHLRELPNAAIDAAMELAHLHGAGALVLAVTDEFARRHTRHAIHPDLP